MSFQIDDHFSNEAMMKKLSLDIYSLHLNPLLYSLMLERIFFLKSQCFKGVERNLSILWLNFIHIITITFILN
jgi:hypothetical protein